METSIEKVIGEIHKLKLESDRWRLMSREVLWFKKRELENKKRSFLNLKESLIKDLEKVECYENDKQYKKTPSTLAIGYLELVLDLHDKLREKEDENLRSVYEKYKSLTSIEKVIIEEKNCGYEGWDYKDRYENKNSNHISSSLEKILKIHDEIFVLEEEIEAKRHFPCEKIIPIEEIEEELSLLNNKLNEKDQIIINLNKRLSELEAKEELSDVIRNLRKKLSELEKNENIENASVESIETVADYSLGWQEIDSKNKEKLQKAFNEKIDLEKNLKEEIKKFKDAGANCYLQLEISKEEVEKLKKKLAKLEIKLENNQTIQTEIIETNEDNHSNHSDSNYSLVEENN